MKTILNAFNAGELSPLLDGRTNFDKYFSGCRLMENFIALPSGAAVKRPGTEYIADVKSHSKKTRLIPFCFNNGQTYMLEFGDNTSGLGYIRFYHDGARILTAEGATYEISNAPYLEAELFEIQFAQSADVMYLVHRNHPPRKLSRYAETDWRLEDIVFDSPAFMDENTEDITITPSATTGGVALTASADVFEAGQIGGYFRISHPRNDNAINTLMEKAGNLYPNVTEPMLVRGEWTLTTGYTWAGTIFLERSFDYGIVADKSTATWQTYRSYASATEGSRNIDTSGTEDGKDIYYRFRIHTEDNTWTSNYIHISFTVRDYMRDGVVKITSVTDARNAIATVINTLGAATASRNWAKGSWSEKNGYPGAVAIFEERLMFGGSKKQPQNIWGSVTNDWEDFEVSDFDDSALAFTVSSDTVNSIRWMIPETDGLLIGTSGAEYRMTSGKSSSDGTAVTASKALCRRQSAFGSDFVQAVMANDTVLYLQLFGKVIHEFAYNYEADKYRSPDLMMLAEHITKGVTITSIAFQRQPDNILWCVRSDGILIAMTYERDQQVVAWHRHTTDGVFESVAVIPGDGEDEIWCVVGRAVSGQPRRFVERFRPRAFDGVRETYFVDCGKSWTYSAADPLPTFPHLAGRTLWVTVNGVQRPDITVDGSGNIALTAPEGAAVTAGLAYSARLKTMRLASQMADGTSQGRQTRAYHTGARFVDSMACKIGNATEQASILQTDKLFSGDEKVSMPAGFTDDPYIYVYQGAPLPLTLVCLMPHWEVYG